MLMLMLMRFAPISSVISLVVLVLILIITIGTAALEESCKMNFFAKLEARVAAAKSLLCVGLDPHEKELFPDGVDTVTENQRSEAAFSFCMKLIDATGKDDE